MRLWLRFALDPGLGMNTFYGNIQVLLKIRWSGGKTGLKAERRLAGARIDFVGLEQV